MTMKTEPTLQDPDGFYERLLDAQQGLDEQALRLFNARLVLLLANQVGDDRVLEQCIDAARRGIA
jgi:hypothetical protein